MGVLASAIVWGHSKATGSALLIALAIADHANDEGRAWPAVATLAKKARTSTRTAQYVLRELVAAGELTIEAGAGPKGCNVYRLMLDVMRGRGANSAGVQTTTEGGAARCTRTIIGNIIEKKEEETHAHASGSTIKFNAESMRFDGIDDSTLTGWRAAFPDVDIDAQLGVAALWAASDSAGPIRSPLAFLFVWLDKAQKKAEPARSARNDKSQRPRVVAAPHRTFARPGALAGIGSDEPFQ